MIVKELFSSAIKVPYIGGNTGASLMLRVSSACHVGHGVRGSVWGGYGQEPLPSPGTSGRTLPIRRGSF